MTTLTKSKIAEVINEKVGLSREDSISLVNEILEEMEEIIAQDFLLKISSFGTFKVFKKKDRIGRNPKTLKQALIKEHNVVGFHPSGILKKIINSD